MRTIAILLISSLIFSSCEKENDEPCYNCTFGNVNGVQYPPQRYCGNDGGARQFVDTAGNNLQSFCVPE